MVLEGNPRKGGEHLRVGQVLLRGERAKEDMALKVLRDKRSNVGLSLKVKKSFSYRKISGVIGLLKDLI